jgi:hypothetical protein
MWKIIGVNHYPKDEDKPFMTVFWSVNNTLGTTNLIFKNNTLSEKLSLDEILAKVKEVLGAEKVVSLENKV